MSSGEDDDNSYWAVIRHEKSIDPETKFIKCSEIMDFDSLTFKEDINDIESKLFTIINPKNNKSDVPSFIVVHVLRVAGTKNFLIIYIFLYFNSLYGILHVKIQMISYHLYKKVFLPYTS